MTRGFFITGTDTGVGKTRFTVVMMNALKAQAFTVAGMKPVATGAFNRNGRLINEDAMLISKNCSKPTAYELINPIVFAPPIAPHIAAKQIKQTIDLEIIKNAYLQLEENNNMVVVEGIGGWRVPFSEKTSTVDLVRLLNLPVILVVGIRLGCLNHALLTAEALRADGMILSGWVSNQIDKDYLFKQETIDTLKKRLVCPHIADLPYMIDIQPDEMLEKIELSLISENLPLTKPA